MRVPSISRRSAIKLTVAASTVGTAHAQEKWPPGTITWINPFPAGGGTDVFARPLAAQVADQLGCQILIDTRGGAGGTVGASQAAKMKPDGSVFFIGAVHHTIAPSVYPNLDYDIEKDFVPITSIASVPQVISVNPNRLPVRTVAELIAYVRANPDKVNFASSGIGTAHHLSGELFQIETKTRMVHVPYRGAGPVMQDLLAGNVDMMFDGMGTSASQIRAGRLIGLAVAQPERSPAFPDIPTSREAGLPYWIVSTWYGLWALKGTPQPIVERMYTELAKAMALPKLQAIWKEQAATAGGERPATFAEHIRSEIDKWRKVAAAAGVKLD